MTELPRHTPGLISYIRSDLAGHCPEDEEEADRMAPLDRDIGALEEAVRNLVRQNETLNAQIEELREEIAGFKDLVANLRGGSRVLIFIGTLVSGGLSAALVKFFNP